MVFVESQYMLTTVLIDRWIAKRQLCRYTDLYQSEMHTLIIADATHRLLDSTTASVSCRQYPFADLRQGGVMILKLAYSGCHRVVAYF